MTSKQPAANKKITSDPRIAAKELIVTRHKSAQLKRQLRGGDRSMKKITQLLKSPERSKHPTVHKTNGMSMKHKPSPKTQKILAERQMSLLKSPRKSKVSGKVDSKEFYPSKVKRKRNRRTVMLKPKHELTKVLSLNKRKLTTPRKGINSPIQQSPPTDPPSVSTLDLTPSAETGPAKSTPRCIEDLVNAYDDDSLTDEDLIEIFTCPSPVWWEDPPDSRYNEDPITTSLFGKRSSCKKDPPSELYKSSAMEKTITTSEDTNLNTPIIEKNIERTSQVDINIELTKKDDKFIKKRSTLENVLSGIKNKTASYKPQVPKCSNNNGSHVSRTSYAGNKQDSIDQVLKDNSGLLQKSLLKHKPSILKNETKRKEDLIDITTDSNTQESSNDDILTGMREDDILNDLENLEIPIQTTEDKEKCTLSAHNECTISDDDSASNLSDKSPEDSMRAILAEDSEQLTFSKEYKKFVPPPTFATTKTAIWSRKEEKNSDNTKSAANDPKEVPENMPPLKKYSKLAEAKMASPGNSKFESGESDFDSSSVISGQDVDTISDTNVKYLNDDQISDYEGDKAKSKTETGASEDSSSESNRKGNEEKSAIIKENETLSPNTACNESNIEVRDEAFTNNDSTQQTAVGTDNLECRKDCIVVYKIIETVSESNEDLSTNTKPRRPIKIKRASNSPKPKNTSTNQQPSFNNINDFFKKCKNACANTKRSKSKVQKGKRNVNKRSKALIKKGRDTDTRNKVGVDKKSIAVTDTKTVNYCLKCSSIFDTQACTYCVMKT